MVARHHPEPASAERVKAVDIPQWAKDEGHNGSATYTVTVGADGKLIALELTKSSMSSAIDAAVKARVERLWFLAATDREGKWIQGTVDVRIGYARHDHNSPGGGMDDYTCGDLLREYDWFRVANAGRRNLFWPENAYTSLASIMQMEDGVWPNRKDMQAQRKDRERMWGKLVKRCRKVPERLFLSELDQPDAYRRLVDSF